jgi:hypothetical protein
MGRRVRREARDRLDARALAGDRAAARLLIRGHDDVDEALEEVALRVAAGAPRLFERLVRLEERSRPAQLEPAVV